MCKTRAIKKTPVAICILLVAAFLLSISYIAAYADHECGGADCHICMCLSAAREFLLQASVAVLLLCASLSATPLSERRRFRAIAGIAGCASPISLHVQMNN
jgi:hypothetical protein